MKKIITVIAILAVIIGSAIALNIAVPSVETWTNEGSVHEDGKVYIDGGTHDVYLIGGKLMMGERGFKEYCEEHPVFALMRGY